MISWLLLASPAIDAALDRGAAFLVERQAEDGAFRSEHYGSFADGWGLTPLVLAALYFSPPNERSREAFRRGSDWLAGLDTQDLSYPLYAPAGAVLVLSIDANRRHREARDRILLRVTRRQLDEVWGWTPADEAYGGFGYYHLDPRKPPDGEFRHELLSSNLSATLFAIGAMAMAELPLDDPAFAKARRFVERCQNFGDDPRLDDGSFFFTPSNDVQNKAMSSGRDREGRVRYRGYGSMTADGLRALLRLGVPRDSARVKAAARWLTANFDAARASGAYPKDREVQRRSVYFYYAWTTAHALVALGVREIRTKKGRVDWPVALSAALLARQGKDGAWRNEATDLREDDPLLATAFAMAALSLSRVAITGQWRTVE